MASLEIYKKSANFIPGVGVNPPDPRRCACGVWSGGRWSQYSQCSRAAKFDAVIDGQQVRVCATHRPEAAKAREDAKQARYDKERVAWDRKYKRPMEYIAALRKIAAGDNDPRATARDVLEKWGDLARIETRRAET